MVAPIFVGVGNDTEKCW